MSDSTAALLMLWLPFLIAVAGIVLLIFSFKRCKQGLSYGGTLALGVAAMLVPVFALLIPIIGAMSGVLPVSA